MKWLAAVYKISETFQVEVEADTREEAQTKIQEISEKGELFKPNEAIMIGLEEINEK